MRIAVIFFGILLAGIFACWLLFDRAPVSTILETDREFERGSRIQLRVLNKTQVRHLLVLGKVWGFLKYHHPAVTAGERQWDFELFRVLPAVVAAADADTFHAVLIEWILRQGNIPACDPCVELSREDLQQRPRPEWLGDENLLGKDLSRLLLDIHRNRVSGQQFYVDLVPRIGNPIFDHELPYADIKLPDAGFQLLALYRFWNIIEYWFPYRDLIDESWDSVLGELIPKIALASSREEYQRQLLNMVARADDAHVNLWGLVNMRPPIGDCQVPVGLRFIDGEAVVTRAHDGVDLRAGDVLLSIDAVAVQSLISDWLPYYAASNAAGRLRTMARFMLRGACGTVDLNVRRGAESKRLAVERVPIKGLDVESLYQDDLPGAAFRRLSDRVAYLKLSNVKAEAVADYIERASGADGLIIDIRNYPAQMVAQELGALLVDSPAEFVRFTRADLSNPGAFYWQYSVELRPDKPRYTGKIIVIVNELSMSRAEYTAMAFRAAPNAVVVGSTTTGADGDASEFFLPGKIRAMISGRGCFYPDKRPTQRIGIVPDVVVQPTIAGIRDGRDEVLEAALRQILGNSLTATQLRAMYLETPGPLL